MKRGRPPLTDEYIISRGKHIEELRSTLTVPQVADALGMTIRNVYYQAKRYNDLVEKENL